MVKACLLKVRLTIICCKHSLNLNDPSFKISIRTSKFSRKKLSVNLQEIKIVEYTKKHFIILANLQHCACKIANQLRRKHCEFSMSDSAPMKTNSLLTSSKIRIDFYWQKLLIICCSTICNLSYRWQDVFIPLKTFKLKSIKATAILFIPLSSHTFERIKT